MAISGQNGIWKLEVEKILVVKSVSAFEKTYEAQGKYALIFLQATNMGQSPQSFTDEGSIRVRSSGGTPYDPAAEVSLPAAMTYNVSFGATIQPGQTEETVVPFDLPLDEPAYFLVPGFSADGNGQSVVLDIPR